MPAGGPGDPRPGRREAAEAQLVRLELDVARRQVALRRVPKDGPLPPSILALLGAALPPVDVGGLQPAGRVRAIIAAGGVEDVVAELNGRLQRLGGRLIAVRAAQRSGPGSGVRVDICG